ncbi:FecR protein [anaerobic digester metagenome]
MLFKKTKYKRLIIKMIQGEASPEEQRIAEKWIDASPANRRIFENYKGLLLLTGKKQVSYDTDKAWARLQQRIVSAGHSAAPVHPISKRRRQIVRYASVSGIAAMLLLAIGLFTILNQKPEIQQFSSTESVSGQFMLPDGSSAVLNANSSVNYPEWFAGHTREISIFGEAFFEISHDAAKPFIVHASGLDIRVVGTSFAVEADPGADFVKVIVNTGKVLVYPSGLDPEKATASGRLLEAGEMATYSRESGQIVKGVNDNLNFLSWKTGILIFKETRLSEVFKALESKYRVSFISSNPDLLNQRLTARFEKESLDQVLETLSLIFNAEFEIQESKVLVR